MYLLVWACYIVAFFTQLVNSSALRQPGKYGKIYVLISVSYCHLFLWQHLSI